MWLYIFGALAIIVCLWAMYTKTRPKKKVVQTPQQNSFNEYAQLSNEQIRTGSKTNKPEQKILLVLKTDKKQLYLKPDLTLSEEPTMDNIFYVHNDDPFLLYNYYRSMQTFQQMADSEIKQMCQKKIFIDAESMNDNIKCYELINNNNMSFGLKYVNDTKNDYSIVCFDNDKITEDGTNAEFVIIRVENDMNSKNNDEINKQISKSSD